MHSFRGQMCKSLIEWKFFLITDSFKYFKMGTNSRLFLRPCTFGLPVLIPGFSRLFTFLKESRLLPLMASLLKVSLQLILRDSLATFLAENLVIFCD